MTAIGQKRTSGAFMAFAQYTLLSAQSALVLANERPCILIGNVAGGKLSNR